METAEVIAVFGGLAANLLAVAMEARSIRHVLLWRSIAVISVAVALAGVLSMVLID